MRVRDLTRNTDGELADLLDAAANLHDEEGHELKRDLCAEAARRLRATTALEPVDPGNTLFETARVRPPGSFCAIRRVDGKGIGMEEYEWLDAPNADDWGDCAEIVEELGETVEFEMVLLTPTRIAVRTYGPKREGSAA